MNSLIKLSKDYDSLISDWFDRASSYIFEDIDDLFFHENKLRMKTEEDENSITIKAEVPGLSEKDIDISYDKNILTIKAEWSENNKNSIRKGKIKRSFTVYDIDSEKIEAKLENGVLILTLPKKEEAKPKKILIK